MAKKIIDKFDLEAEAEANAIGKFRRNFSGEAPVGKRIRKMRNGMQRGATIVNNKATKHIKVTQE
jgi:hypothetical protein